jgi:hypothetical protein
MFTKFRLFFLSDCRKKMVTTLQEFYQGKVVLLTGATGFLGKALLLKLLLSCPDIKSIIVLLRRRNHDSVSARLAETLSSSVSTIWLRLKKWVPWELVGRPKYSERTCSNVTFPTANAIWPDRCRTRDNALLSRRLTDHGRCFHVLINLSTFVLCLIASGIR